MFKCVVCVAGRIIVKEEDIHMSNVGTHRYQCPDILMNDVVSYRCVITMCVFVCTSGPVAAFAANIPF